MRFVSHYIDIDWALRSSLFIDFFLAFIDERPQRHNSMETSSDSSSESGMQICSFYRSKAGILVVLYFLLQSVFTKSFFKSIFM